MGYRYIGSKEKLANKIISKIKEITPKAERVIDLMAGTGLFSKALKESGFKVTASDVMTYSYHHLNVQLKLSCAPKFTFIDAENSISSSPNDTLFPLSTYQLIINHLNNLKSIRGYFWKEFSPEGSPKNTLLPRKYFTPENAAKIDSIRMEIKNLYKTGKISEIEHSLLIHDLIMAANDIANIAGTYGHYLSRFTARAKDDLFLKPSIFSDKGQLTGHKIYKGYAENLAEKMIGDICYIDPPYIKRQYAANYHVLETIAREDFPEAIGVSGLRPWRDQYSNFCTKTKIRASFTKIIENIKCVDILISYSEDGLLPIEDFKIFLSTFGEVQISKIRYKRFKSNNSKLGLFLYEYLIHLKKVN